MRWEAELLALARRHGYQLSAYSPLEAGRAMIDLERAERPREEEEDGKEAERPAG